MKQLVFVAAAAALALSACETPTPYQPAMAQNPSAGGYSDQQIEGDRWRVTFSGNDLTSRETVERYLLFRAAQLTLAQGYDWFQADQRHTDKQTTLEEFGGPGWGGYWGPTWGYYRRGYGWAYGAYPYGCGRRFGPCFPAEIDEVSKFQASAEIVLGHGPKPPTSHAFDARAVVAHLQPTIKYPTAKT
jgi:hypothetical protein